MTPRYLEYERVLGLHLHLVRGLLNDDRVAVLSETLVRSALARPRHAAVYDQADEVRQAAYLFHGLLMNHGFVHANERTAYVVLEWFLQHNGFDTIRASDAELVDLCRSVAAQRWSVDLVDMWLRPRVQRVAA